MMETQSFTILASDVAPPKGLTLEQLITILDLARWAPSGDNYQPWRVRTSADRAALEVLLDDQQPPAFLDVNLEASRIALGAFIENIRLAASQLGIASEIELAPHDAEIEARLRFSQSQTITPDPLADYLTQRVSNRRHYAPQSCTPDQLAALADAISSIVGTGVQFYSDPEDLATIARAVAIADRVRMQHQRCHEEFHEKVRWTDKAVADDPTGFSVKTFEVRPHEVALLRLTRSYRVFKWTDRLTGMSRVAARVARQQVLASGAVGMLTVAERTSTQMLRAGQALERLWLAATRTELAFQVLAVAPLFLRRCVLGGEGFTSAEQQRLGKSRELLASLPDGPAPESVAVMFRIGRAQAPTARTARLPAAALFAFAKQRSAE